MFILQEKSKPIIWWIVRFVSLQSGLGSRYSEWIRIQWKDACLRIHPQTRLQSPLQSLDIVPLRYEIIRILLRIVCMLPSTTRFAERAIKLLKTYLRNGRSDEQLTGQYLWYTFTRRSISINMRWLLCWHCCRCIVLAQTPKKKTKRRLAWYCLSQQYTGLRFSCATSMLHIQLSLGCSTLLRLFAIINNCLMGH